MQEFWVRYTDGETGAELHLTVWGEDEVRVSVMADDADEPSAYTTTAPKARELYRLWIQGGGVDVTQDVLAERWESEWESEASLREAESGYALEKYYDAQYVNEDPRSY